MRSHVNVLVRLLIAVVMLFCGPLSMAGPFPGWDYRTRVQFDNSTGIADLTDFPVLVTLDSSNFDFSRASADGSDVRFADSDGTVLSYELEKWNSAAGQAAVWVKVPQIDSASNVDFINMYYGNTGAADAQNAPDVWSNGYKGVWHLSSTTGTEPDSTGRHDGTVSGGPVSASGVIGQGRLFSNNGYISARSEDLGPGVSSLDAGDDISVTYWMKANPGNASYQRNLGKDQNHAAFGIETQRAGSADRMDLRIDTSGGLNQVKPIGNPSGNTAYDGDWHFIGFTLDTGTWRTFYDTDVTSASYNPGGGFSNTQPLYMGSNTGGGSKWSGTLDEFRFSDTVRSQAWMNAEYRSQSGQLAATAGTNLMAGLVAEYSHENAGNRLLDTSGNGYDAINGGGGGGVAFVSTADPQGFDVGLGDTVGSYARSQAQRLDMPASIIGPRAIDPADGFTFTALVRGDGLVAGTGHQTILSSNRFRFQRGNSDQFLLQLNRTSTSGTDYGATSSNGFAADSWYMAALRYDALGNKAETFLIPSTGIVTSPNVTLTPTDPLTDLSAFRVGSDGLSGIGSFDGWGGLIDNGKFYQGSLTKRQLRDVFYSYTGQSGAIGLVAKYDHEGADPLTDDTGHGLDATNAGGVTFAAPTSPGDFSAALGSTAGQYPYASNGYLNVPELYTEGDDFTFMALVRVGDDNAFHTVLGSDRFRLQYQPQTAGDGAGVLGLQVNHAGVTGPAASTADLFPTGQWQWVAMTYDAATRQIQAYLQPDSPVFFGPAMTQTANDGGGINGLNDMARFRIGYDGLRSIGGGDAFAGQIDGVRFYDQAFSRAEMRQLFSQYRPSGPVGLVARYNHEGADPLTDDTGHLVSLTQQGNVTFVDSSTTSPGVFATGLGDTVGQYASSGRLDVRPFYNEGDDFSFAGLVRVTDENAFHTILSSDRFRFQYRRYGAASDGFGALNLQTNAPGASGPADTGDLSFPVNDWRFVALTYDAATKQIQAYLQDGSPVFAGAALAQTANGTAGWSDMTQFRIGYDGLSGIGGVDGFVGQIDGVRFYDQALSPLQLRDLFRTLTGHSPGPLGMVARFDHENAGNRLQDDTGNGLDATNGGTVTFAAPIAPGPFDLGTAAGQYPRNGTGCLDIPNVHTPGDDFTFIAMVRKDGNAPGHQTIFSTDRFRFQFRGTSTDAGTLRLDVGGAGASGPNEVGDDSFPTEEWQYVAMTYDAATHEIQVWQQDGSPVFLGPDMLRTAGGAIGIDDISRFRLGGDGLSGVPWAGFDAFGGQIDGIRFYDTLLSKRELRDVFRTYNPLPAGTVGLVAQYKHEGTDPLTDDTGHGVTAESHGSVSFGPPPDEGMFHVGDVVGQYPRADDSYLGFPEFYTEGDDFTFTALVRKNNDETGGHQTILASDRFRLQYRDTGGDSNGAGTLHLGVVGDGTGESGDDSFLTEQWYFMAMRYNAVTGDLDAFLDDGTGGLAAPAFSMTGIDLDDMVDFRVGADGLSGIGSPDPFGGWIDSIQFYDRFLSDGQLRQVYLSYVPEPASIVLLLLGMGALPLLRRWRRRRATG